MTDNDICKFFVEFDLKFRQLELELRARLNDVWVRVNCVEDRLPFIEDHKTRQLDENRKISHRVDELETEIKELKRFQDITHEQYKLITDRKRPHKCPVCDGFGKKLYLIAQESRLCDTCEGKGIVWG
jgi:predicted nuclease with TOPRIM domain